MIGNKKLKMFDFNKIVNREGTDSVKWDLRKSIFGDADVLPMWVADMDFETPDFVTKAVIERAKHPVYGYSFFNEKYFKTLIAWNKRRHGWEIEKDWIVFSPGIVTAVKAAVLAYSAEGDGVIVQPPVYFPFFDAIKINKRKQLTNQLLYLDQTYKIDFDDLEKKAKKAKLILISSPHNPVSRCWTKEELLQLGEICLRNEVIIISDEIHADLILPGYKHIPIASLSDELAEITVTCMAPSKTFNVAGLFNSSIIIKNQKLRKQFVSVMESLHLVHSNVFAMTASEAAYADGDEWVDEMMAYVKGNFDLLDSFLKTEIPLLSLTKPEATFLAWIDFSKTGLSNKEIRTKLVKEAGLGLSPGTVFGDGGSGFMRMNLACPRIVVEEALRKLKKVF